MESTRIRELLQPFVSAPLSSAQLEQISIYIDLLTRWNARINLTAIRHPEEIVTRHFGESFFASRHLLPGGHPQPTPPSSGYAVREADASARLAAYHVESPAGKAKVVDLGSGAGFPGIPLKISSPGTPVTLIESNQKKVAFLREVIRALTLTDIDVFAGRAEDYGAASASLVTLRAVERFADALPTAAQLLAPHGVLALLISQPQVDQAQAILPSFYWSPPTPIPLSAHRVLLAGTRI
jgi:16S rRNA (guanine527-N7)-methyltransferase